MKILVALLKDAANLRIFLHIQHKKGNEFF
jgi:hypothetical protein